MVLKLKREIIEKAIIDRVYGSFKIRLEPAKEENRKVGRVFRAIATHTLVQDMGLEIKRLAFHTGLTEAIINEDMYAYRTRFRTFDNQDAWDTKEYWKKQVTLHFSQKCEDVELSQEFELGPWEAGQIFNVLEDFELGSGVAMGKSYSRKKGAAMFTLMKILGFSAREIAAVSGIEEIYILKYANTFSNTKIPGIGASLFERINHWREQAENMENQVAKRIRANQR